jgi:hypothetical protein
MKNRSILLLLLLAVVFSFPSLSAAGDVQSRFDVNIGGFVKFDAGWGNQGVGADYGFSQRKSGPTKNILDEYGNFYMASGESRFNFLIKGPDAWGAKTWAFIEADFRAVSGGVSTSYGSLGLRHAFMRFDWASDSLLIGNYWAPWNYFPALPVIGFNVLGNMKQVRDPQIKYTHTWAKDFDTAFAILYPTKAMNSVNGQNLVDDFSRSLLPHFTGNVQWKGDQLGKIGPFKLTLGAGGFIGQENVTYATSGGRGATVTSTTVATGGVLPNSATATGTAANFDDQGVLSWVGNVYAYIPIIPEKQEGNKGGALSVMGGIFYGSNFPLYLGPFALGSADRYGYNNTAPFDYVAPTLYQWWSGAVYYFTDQVYLSGAFGQSKANMSHALRASNPNFPMVVNTYLMDLTYDVTSAVRLGLEGTYLYTRYAGPGTGTATGVRDYGKLTTVRAAAWYFF